MWIQHGPDEIWHAPPDFLDLSPLAKFMGRKHWKSLGQWLCDEGPLVDGDLLDDAWGTRILIGGTWRDLTPDLARMYGWEIDPPAAPIPEKSPFDKALENFVAKRKAKRTDAEAQAESAGIMTNAR